MLSAYTSRGILTINEARAALGRDPLADPAADRPMALTGAGYVALGGAMPAGAAKFNKAGEWDESQHPRWPAGAAEGHGGRFAPSDGEPVEPGRRTAGIVRAYVTNNCLRIQAFKGPGMVAYGAYSCGAFNVITSFPGRIPPPALSIDSPAI